MRLKILSLLRIVLFLICFMSCEKDFSPIGNKKLFHPDRLSQLSLDSVGDFWASDTINDVSDFVTANFDLHAGHLSSIRYSSEKGKDLAVSVFETQEIAIDAMEERVNNVAALIFPGDSYGDWDKETYEAYRDLYWFADTQERIEDRWWWSIYIFGNAQRGIFINKWNTIIEAGNLYDDLSDSTRVLLEDAAIEIADRVEALSE